MRFPLALCAFVALLAAPARPGLAAGAAEDGVVTARNLISLGYSYGGGKLYLECLTLTPDGGARWDEFDVRRGTATRRVTRTRVDAARLAQILRLANAAHFPTLGPRGYGPRAVDGVCGGVTLTYRDRAGRHREYSAWDTSGSPRAVSRLCSALSDVPKGTPAPRGRRGPR